MTTGSDVLCAESELMVGSVNDMSESDVESRDSGYLCDMESNFSMKGNDQNGGGMRPGDSLWITESSHLDLGGVQVGTGPDCYLSRSCFDQSVFSSKKMFFNSVDKIFVSGNDNGFDELILELEQLYDKKFSGNVEYVNDFLGKYCWMCVVGQNFFSQSECSTESDSGLSFDVNLSDLSKLNDCESEVTESCLSFDASNSESCLLTNVSSGVSDVSCCVSECDFISTSETSTNQGDVQTENNCVFSEVRGETVMMEKPDCDSCSWLSQVIDNVSVRNTECMLLTSKFDCFDGETVSLFSSWFRLLKARVELLGVSNDVKVVHLFSCLSGKARIEFDEQNSNLNWESAIKYLTDKYVDRFADAKKFGKFRSRMQGEKESVWSYVSALKNLCPFYPTERLYNESLLNQLAVGLYNIEFRVIVGTALRNGETEFDKLVHKLIVLEDVNNELFCEKEQTLCAGSKTRSRVTECSRRPKFRGYGNDGIGQTRFINRLCYVCRTSGHLAAHCPIDGNGDQRHWLSSGHDADYGSHKGEWEKFYGFGRSKAKFKFHN